MPLLLAEANKLTNDSLQRGTIEVFIERGAPDLLRYLPFKGFQGQAYAHNIELTLPTDRSQRDPYGTSIPGGVGTRNRFSTPSAMLTRNADTAKIDVVGKSDFSDQRTQDHILAAKALARDFMEQFVNGDGQGYNCTGMEYWINWFAGWNPLNGAATGLSYTDQKVFNTTAGTAADYANAQSLSLNVLDDMLSRYKGSRFDVIVSDRGSYVKFKSLLNAAGGNMAPLFQKDNFGVAVPNYDGVPWIILDPVGQRRFIADADYTHTSTTIVVDTAADPYFTGFTDADIGRTIVWNATASEVATIASVTNYKTIVLAAAPVGVSGDEATKAFTVEPANLIYGLRFDEEDGATSLYHANNGNQSPNVGEYYGPIAGFDAEDMGLLEDSPRYRTRLDWFGNFVVHQPYSIVRLSHFTV